MTGPVPLRLAAGSGPTFGVDDIACAAATTLGFWREEGLDVTWLPVHGGVQAATALLGGRVDVAYGGLGPVIRARAEDKPIRVVVAMARGLAQNLIGQRRIISPDALRGVSWALDGFGALSHHMARLVVRALRIDEREIRWQAVGPPPERIAKLLSGEIDVSLIRVEEALSLSRTHAQKLHTLLGFADLKRLVPVQPHGVLSTTEAFELAHPDSLSRLARGMIRASRALHDDYSVFRVVYDKHVTLPLPDAEIRRIWQQEHDTGGFAVNGGLAAEHWDREIELYCGLNPELPRVHRRDVLATGFVADALSRLGRHAAPFDPPPE
jgi:ABC-type nitrate/sulfonate/bicarbonate transport system substrate-binding protein